MTREPNEPVMCSLRALPSLEHLRVGWSTWVSGTVMPASRVTRTSSREIGLVVAVRAVLVLDLHEDDGSALVDLPRRDDLVDPLRGSR